MDILKTIINVVFECGLFVNALLFIPQIVRIVREKSSRGVSLLTFFGFWVIQLFVILHALVSNDYWLLIGYSISFIACGSVVVLILIYRKR
ncbi:MAG: hypothetical protein KAS93_05380 [Gammaproteobacteria bacterium]|nr:hypothetical protein [Gammaproteobacteria bacterium]